MAPQGSTPANYLKTTGLSSVVFYVHTLPCVFLYSHALVFLWRQFCRRFHSSAVTHAMHYLIVVFANQRLKCLSLILNHIIIIMIIIYLFTFGAT